MENFRIKKSIVVPGILFVVIVVLSTYYFRQSERLINYPSGGTDIIAFGDSLVEGVGATAGNDFVSLLSKEIGEPIINLGHSGDTSSGGVARLSELDKYNPKVVLLLFGGNDYLRKIPVSETRENLAVMIRTIQGRGAVVLLLGIRGGILTDGFRDEFETLHDTYHTAYVPDVLDGLFGNSEYMSDTVHPNDAGYKKISERIAPVLQAIIKK